MSDLFATAEAAVKPLSPQERLTLAEQLLASLPEEMTEDVEAQWATEIQRRWQRYQSGQTVTSSAEDVFARLEGRPA